MGRKRSGSLLEMLFICVLFMLCLMPGLSGAETAYQPPAVKYVLKEDSNFDYVGTAPKSGFFFYGAETIGEMWLNGPIEQETTYNGYTAYGATGAITFRYDYDGKFKKDNTWHLVVDGLRWIRDYDLGFMNNMANGCIMVERSTDTIHWEKVIDPIKNYFDKAKENDESRLCTIEETEYKNGMYYRIVVAYKMGRKTGGGIPLVNDQEYRKCAEVYEFYLSSENNYVTFSDIGNGLELANQASTETGFMVRKNNSRAVVTIQGREQECLDYEYIAEPGVYDLTVTTQLGKQYSHRITVSTGLDFTSIAPRIYGSDRNKGFPLTTAVTQTTFGGLLTSLYLATPKGTSVVQQDAAYGMTGQSVALYLKLNLNALGSGSDWSLVYDEWGKAKEQTVCGTVTGEVGKGALIIQTSREGKGWSNANQGRYRDGLYTTDYASHYGKTENVLIYTPSGKDVLNGIHIRVLFAYQVQNTGTKTYYDYVEGYQFYLCSNELGAVTFHNLSVAEQLEESFADADQNTIAVYKQAESLGNASYTTTGFQIDKTLNPTVKHEVRMNGEEVSDKHETSFEETGRYDITLTSMVGSTKQYTIYVDRRTPEEAMSLYFGEGFISGKRIYAEGSWPVYEGGRSSYRVAGLNGNAQPLYGRITNLTTGSTITIEQNVEEKTGTLDEPGEYQAVFATSEQVFTDELTGDARVFTFHFLVIPEGTAPGPVINQKLLEDYSHTTAADCNPVYYGLTYSSAEKGKITIAFASKKAAVDYAYEYEKGMVEIQENGGYRYNGRLEVDQNIRYDSAWDLTDAVYYFAEAGVHRHYFDMSDVFTYLTLKPEDLASIPNLRQVEFPRSVTVFAEGEKEKLTEIDALPLLNDKPYAYLNPKTGEEERGVYSFEFVTDQYGGLDSKTVTITDSKGGSHDIRYSESVGKQLLADLCPSGIVTIREETMYGDYAEYQAVYIAPESNQTEITLNYKQGDSTGTVVYTKADSALDTVVDAFTIAQLTDPVDPYAFVVVRHGKSEDIFTAQDSIEKEWTEPGYYSIICRNRMGYGYTIPVMIASHEGNTAAGQRLSGTSDEQQTGEKTNTLQATVTEQKSAETTGNLSSGSDSPEQAGKNTNKDTKQEASGSGNAVKQAEQNNGGNTVILIIILAVAAAVVLIIFRRIKLFSRVTKDLKGGEDKKDE